MQSDETSPPHDDVPAARPAATIVIFRNDPSGGPAQLLLVERSGSMVFAGGATVFPGGRVDDADRALASRLAPQLDLDDAAARIAAIRETLEETGLVVGVQGTVNEALAAAARQRLLETGTLSPVLDEFAWTPLFDDLVPFARWWPRMRETRIYDTRFYLADLGTGAVDLVVDSTENQHLFWASAQEALQMADDGRIKVIFPTRRNLERLARFPDFAGARAHALATPVVTITPWIEQREGVSWLMIRDDAGYPVRGERLSSAFRG
ncbi:NUDIX domain-containing protein [Novosphingobium sp.]|uniref:NUDIX domain-containing protein n=1 Tax=Novosphingobium sp. TaxID=1874826 RepID=UPI0038B94EB9